MYEEMIGKKVLVRSYDAGVYYGELVAVNGDQVKVLMRVCQIIPLTEHAEPTPPGIEEESQRKGWLNYGLMMSEIGLHRYNAIHRIKEHKEQFNPQAVPDLYHVAEYYKAVGAEITCCCLQAYGKDFIFTQDEVKEIIETEDEK